MLQNVLVFASLQDMLTGTPIAETTLDLPSDEDIAIAQVFDMIDSGEITFPDPEAASGHLDRSYYNNPAWLTEERGEIDIFAF